MGTIVFNAFSFLQKKLKARNIPCVDATVVIDKGQTVMDILRSMAVHECEIEGIFVNGKIAQLSTVLHDGDRVAALPPGTPGPYRLLLGIVTNKNGRGLPPDDGAHDE